MTDRTRIGLSDITVVGEAEGDSLVVTGAGNVTASGVTGGSGPGDADFTIWSPDAPPNSPSAYDDEFDDASFATGLWTEFDVSASMTPNEAEYGFYMTGGTSGDVQGIFQDVPDQDFVIYTYVAFLNNSDGDHNAGLFLIEDTGNLSTTNVYTYGIFRGSSMGLRSHLWTDYNTAFDTEVDRVTGPGGYEPGYYLRLRQIGSDWDFGYSVDGMHWFDFDNGHTEDFTVDGVGLFQRLNIVGDTNNKAVFKFFRYSTNAAVVDIMYGDRVKRWRN